MITELPFYINTKINYYYDGYLYLSSVYNYIEKCRNKIYRAAKRCKSYHLKFRLKAIKKGYKALSKNSKYKNFLKQDINLNLVIAEKKTIPDWNDTAVTMLEWKQQIDEMRKKFNAFKLMIIYLFNTFSNSNL